MSNSLTVTLKIKRKLWFKLLFKFVLFLHFIYLIKDDHVLKIVNSSLTIGAFKQKVDNGKWKNLKIDQKFEFAD